MSSAQGAVDGSTDATASSAAAPTNGEAPPSLETSEANINATKLDEPALPPTSPSDETKNTGKETDLDMKATSTTVGVVSGDAVVAPEGDAAAHPTKNGKDKRRSSVGIPEHKGKKLNKKKSMVTLNLEAKPGDYYWARMKGYPPWPAIICDEEMLPESLLQNRPVTAMRPDGTYRDDYADGGKNVKDRTFPVMYLGTNEFSWMSNIDIKPLDFTEVDEATSERKSKQLWVAYELCRERHDLQHFKDLLAEHEEAVREELAEIEKAAAEKAERKEKKEKSAKRKSKAAEEPVQEDVEMEDETLVEDGEGTKKAKPSKKRKKDADSEGEVAKPVKTPKTKLKVNLSKAADVESATKPKAKPKASKAKVSPKPAPPMTEAEKRQKREKEVLYFRHKLQKGFLSGETPPKEEEMKAMADHFTSLEAHEDLEHSIIKTTKIHKVLKAILKLTSIPKDEEYNFKQRSLDLLQKWQKIIAENTEGGEGDETTTIAPKDTEMKEEEKTAPGVSEPAEALVEKKEELGNGAKDEATDVDVAMTDAKEEQAKAEVPIVEDGAEEVPATTDPETTTGPATEVMPLKEA